ncbi:unnamed protein product, partial [Ixodes pacificus]
RPAPGAPTVEQLSRKYPKHLPTSAVIGNSQTRYLFHNFDSYDKATPAFITIRGASTFNIEKELANIPRSVTTLIFHVGTSELEKFGSDETLRRCRRLVNNTLQARPELHSLLYRSCCRGTRTAIWNNPMTDSYTGLTTRPANSTTRSRATAGNRARWPSSTTGLRHSRLVDFWPRTDFIQAFPE